MANMKMQYEDYQNLSTAIWDYMYKQVEIDHKLSTVTDLIRKYERGEFPRSDKVKDLQRRFCFDMLYGARTAGFVSGMLLLYAYLDDDQIYTALKNILPIVERNY